MCQTPTVKYKLLVNTNINVVISKTKRPLKWNHHVDQNIIRAADSSAQAQSIRLVKFNVLKRLKTCSNNSNSFYSAPMQVSLQVMTLY